MISVVDHLESHLGIVEAGWSKNADGHSMPFQVVRFSGAPIDGCQVFSTLGLSKYELASRVSNKLIRHELVVLARRSFGDRNIPSLLLEIGSEALEKQRAYLRGDVIGPRGPLFEGSGLQAFYVAMPAYFPDSFATFNASDGEAVVIAWLVPISAREAEYVRSKGWEAFEDELLRRDPDLADFSRPDLPLEA